MTARIVRSPVAAVRLAEAGEWLRRQGRARELVIVAANREAAALLARRVAHAAGATFGWQRVTLGRLAGALAAEKLAARGATPVGGLPREALVARAFHALARRGEAGRFARIEDRPGLPRALARTLEELRLAGLTDVDDPELARVLSGYESELVASNLADRAEVLRFAAERAREAAPHALLGKPLLFLDVAVTAVRERELVAAVASRAEEVLATVPEGDDRAARALAAALETTIDDVVSPVAGGALARLHAGLFSEVAAKGERGDDVELFSAPGESRECVEIARRVRAAAERGTPFDRVAILVRSPAQYRTHVEEALRRASIPAYFARGAVRPDEAGRALLALLACASEGLSARRFAEYLSLGEVPDPTPNGAPPPAPPAGDRYVPPDEETLSDAIARAAEPAAAARPEPSGGTLPAPRHWEKLLVDAAVIGGLDRWAKRLDALRAELEIDRKELTAEQEAIALRIDRDLAALESLRRFALPLLEDLAALEAPSTWGVWIDRLSALAARALRDPARVQATLAELAPMADVGPVTLGEVRLALERRLCELVMAPSVRPAGRVFVASPEEARGLDFDVVFVPGLAEKMFPQKIVEDPIATDAARAALGADLRTNAERSAAERLALRLAVGAASKKVVLSYPRLDIDQSRPRTPSFYALEVLRAATGALPGFDQLAREAESTGGARVGWPAPVRSEDAIDEAEHDLALLGGAMQAPEEQAIGRAHFLLNANVHLARALRFRSGRWNVKRWTYGDGLILQGEGARAALAAHQLSARSFSPTALQHYAACPYRFVLQAIHRLAPREEPVPIEELDPLQKGSLVHDTLFALMTRLRDEGALPITPQSLDGARAALDEVLAATAAEYEAKLAPSIERVWKDEIERIKADLRELLRRASESPEWVPAYFELSFGLAESRGGEDPKSTRQWVTLDCGINLRGSIDLVERNAASGKHRASDYKTGKVRAEEGAIIAGGKTLQPVLYALAIEKLLGVPVEGGRLYYCTATGGFTSVSMPLDDEAREAAQGVASALKDALDNGFFPALPQKGECEWCDYRAVCGPHEERRTRKKLKMIPAQDKERLAPLVELRKRP